MTSGDIVEIVAHNEKGRLNLRRVRVTSVRKSGDRLRVSAGNLRGKFVRQYDLPAEPITNALDPELRNCVNWVVPTYFNEKADP